MSSFLWLEKIEEDKLLTFTICVLFYSVFLFISISFICFLFLLLFGPLIRQTGTTVAGDLGQEGRERGANTAAKYGRPEGGRSRHAPINQYLLHVSSSFFHHEWFLLRLSRFYSNQQARNISSWYKGLTGRSSGNHHLHFQTVVGPETPFCPLVCVFEGLKPEFCCLKVLSLKELLFYDDAFSPAAPVLLL